MKVREDHSGAVSDEHLVVLWLTGRPTTTQRVYRMTVSRFLARLQAKGLSLQTATVADLIEWVDTLSGAPRTKARAISTVKSLLTYAHRTGYTVFNVGRALRCPKIPDDLHERIMEETDIRTLFEAAREGQERVFLRFLYTSGARVSEACGVRFKDIVGNRVTLMRGKGGRSRTVVVPIDVLDAVRELRRPSDHDGSLVFKSRWGTPLKPRTAQMMLKRISARASQEATPHYFRHAHATHSLDHGAPIHVVQRSLGHKNVSTTSRYLHARPTEGASQYLTFNG